LIRTWKYTPEPTHDNVALLAVAVFVNLFGVLQIVVVEQPNVLTPFVLLHPLEDVALQFAFTRKMYSLQFAKPVAVKVEVVDVAEVQTLVEETGAAVYSIVYEGAATTPGFIQEIVAFVESAVVFVIVGVTQGVTTTQPFVFPSRKALQVLEAVAEQIAFTLKI
jgi:hypothetical protein